MYTLEIDERNPSAHVGIAAIRAQRGRTEEAKHHYRVALEEAPGNFAALRNLALLLHVEGQDEEAMALLLRGLAIHDGDVQAHVAAGEILISQGKPEGIAAYRKALALTPDDAALRARLAWVRAPHPNDVIRNGKRALEHARRAVRGTRNPPIESLDALAAAQAEVGAFDEAVKVVKQALQRAVRTAPGRVQALRERLRMYEAQRPWRER